MQELSDTELLRQYAESNSEAAFETLVTRHIALVYSAALRKTGNFHAAEEISQTVFIILAKKASALRRETILSGWLYQAARLTAANFLRNEIRRVRREQEAFMESQEPDLWPQIVPLLEDAMGRLNEKERNAIVLRFFEGKSFQEIGTVSGASENAAKKRVAYALEKLRKIFAHRGVSSTTAIIAGILSTHSVQAAPAGLVKTISAIAITKGATASVSTLTLTKGALKIMAWTNLKTATVAGVAVVLATATAGVMIKTENAPPPEPVAAVYKDSLNGTDSIPQVQLGDTLSAANRVNANPNTRERIAELRKDVWPKEKAAMEQKIAAGQQTDETSDPMRIDLTPYINVKLTDDPVGGKANNLSGLPLGVNIFGGVPFDVEGAIFLMGGGLALHGQALVKEVDNIPIGRHVRKIHLFHGEQYIFFGDYGNTVAKLILHYEDGSTNEFDLIAGQQALDMWAPLFSTGASPANLNTAPGTVAAWTGTNPMIHRLQPDESLVLLRTTFENPRPDLTVSSVDYVSNNTMTVPMLLGLTVE